MLGAARRPYAVRHTVSLKKKADTLLLHVPGSRTSAGYFQSHCVTQPISPPAGGTLHVPKTGSEQTASVEFHPAQPPLSQSKTDSLDSGLLLLTCKQTHHLVQVLGGGMLLVTS